MGKTVIVYVCNGEFNDFEGDTFDEEWSGNNTYKVRSDGDHLFLAVKNAEEVHNAKIAIDSKLPSSILVEKIDNYLDTLHSILKTYFGDESEMLSMSVFIITHWGGGAPEEIDTKETVIKDALKNSTDGRFRGWVMFSASETHRSRLFSDEFSTVFARAHNVKAKLPDAKECEGILFRYKNKEYATPVNWSEKDSKKLYDDIMKHLNH